VHLAAIDGAGDYKFKRLAVSDFSRQWVGAFSFDRLVADDATDDSHTELGHGELRGFPLGNWIDFVGSGSPPDRFIVLVELGSFSMTDFVQKKGKGDSQTVRIAGIEIGKVDRKKLEKFDLRGFQYEGADPSKDGVTVGAVELVGLEWEQLLPLLGKIDPATALATSGYSVEKFSMRDFGGTTLGSLGVTIGEIAFSTAIDSESAKGHSVVKIDKFEIDRSKTTIPEIADFLKSLDYDKVSLSLNAVSSSDRKAGTTTVEKMLLTAPGVGSIDIKAKFSGFQPAAKTEDVISAAMSLQIERYDLSWRDDGLTDRLISSYAVKSGMDLERMREAMVGQLRLASAQYQRAPQVAASMQAFAAYLQKPGTLIIELKPEPPITLARYFELMFSSDPNALAETYRALGLTVTAQ